MSGPIYYNKRQHTVQTTEPRQNRQPWVRRTAYRHSIIQITLGLQPTTTNSYCLIAGAPHCRVHESNIYILMWLLVRTIYTVSYSNEYAFLSLLDHPDTCVIVGIMCYIENVNTLFQNSIHDCSRASVLSTEHSRHPIHRRGAL